MKYCLITLLFSTLLIPRTLIVNPVLEPPLELEEVGWRIVTGYSSEVQQTDNTPHITAAQTPVRKGILACPRYYPFSTKFLINDQIYVCEDRCNIRYRHRFDIWFPTTEEAKQWGKQIVFIKLVQS